MTLPQRAADFDIAIVGGGLVGTTMAGLIAREPALDELKIALLDAQVPAPPVVGEPLDLRVSAVSRASQLWLRRLTAWQALPADRVCAYERMVVWDADGAPEGRGSIHFEAAAIGEPDLGAIVENRALLRALRAPPAFAERVTTLRTPLTGLDLTGALAKLVLADGRSIRARLVIAADGAQSPARALAGITVRARPYAQAAVVTHVRSALPHRETAWQRFLPDGPLALLPLADGRSSIVWSTTPQHAEALLAMGGTEFGAALTESSANVLGRLEADAPRASFPLQALHAERYIAPRFALVGDAAHAVHPLAGQGVNLGLADAACLVTELARGRSAGDDGWHEQRTLRRYERARRSENLLAAGAIDGLKYLFAAHHPLAVGLRQGGLALLDRSVTVKRLLALRALGLTGDIPLPPPRAMT